MFPSSVSSTSRFLAAQSWFVSLPLSTQTQVDEHVLRTTGKKGDVMLPANTPVEGWYAVLSGLVKVQSVPVMGRSSTFLGVACGDWFGEGSALKIEPRRYEVIALRDTELLCLPQDELANLVGVSRQTANRALKSLAQRGLVTLEFGRVDIPDDEALTRFIFSTPEPSAA